MTRTKRENPLPLHRRELLRKQELADLLGIGVTRLKQLRADYLPKPIVVGDGGTLYWRRREIIDWVSAGCPKRVRWSWEPSDLMPVTEQVRLRRIELNDLEQKIEAKQKELEQ